MRVAPHLRWILAAMLLTLAGCEVSVGPPEDQSKPHAIQVPPAQAAVMGKGIDLQKPHENAANQDEQPADQPPIVVAQREGKSKRTGGDAEKFEGGPPSGMN